MSIADAIKDVKGKMSPFFDDNRPAEVDHASFSGSVVNGIMDGYMSPIVKKFLATALIYLVLGLLVQAVSVFDGWLGFNPLAYTAIAVTQQLFLLGWLTQLGLALVYDRWLSPPPESAMMVFVLFNIGLLLVLLGQPGLALLGGTWLGAAAAIGGLLQLLAGLLFVGQAWSALKKL